MRGWAPAGNRVKGTTGAARVNDHATESHPVTAPARWANIPPGGLRSRDLPALFRNPLVPRGPPEVQLLPQRLARASNSRPARM